MAAPSCASASSLNRGYRQGLRQFRAVAVKRGCLEAHLPKPRVNTYVHFVTSAEFKRWIERQGATFEPAKGGNMWVFMRGRRAILPMHGSRKQMKLGTVAAIKKQLGLE